ncbi:MAG: hypothetical protein COA86_13050 [Kangiella sp.]|nr:MAG: hypothetical protein COA86_13050 [Kangiella sp.]
MKLLIGILFCFLTFSTYSNEIPDSKNPGKEYPPKHWWMDFVSFKDVEQEWEDFQKPVLYATWKVSCEEYSEPKEISKRIKRLDCIKYNEYSSEELDNKYKYYLKHDALVQNRKWITFKKLLRKGDSIIEYSAPPLSGGFGVIILRKEKSVAYFEFGVQ